jgi:hypothetical protein
MKQKRTHKAGDWIAIPLNDGWAIGLIARMNARYGQCLGYFFGPLVKELPTLEQLKGFSPRHTILVTKFLSAELEDGEWPVIGEHIDWDPRRWLVPPFR